MDIDVSGGCIMTGQDGNFAAVLKTARKATGLSQAAIARKAGCRQVTYTTWERGEAYPLPSKLPVLSKALAMDVEVLRDAYSEECAHRIHEQSGIMCGECKAYWMPDKERLGSVHMGTCAQTMRRTERCDWCVLPVGVLA